MIKSIIRAIIISLQNFFSVEKKAPAKRVMVVCENGYGFEEEVKYTESGKAYITNGSTTVFLDNPEQKEGEIKPYTNGAHQGYAYKRWYYI